MLRIDDFASLRKVATPFYYYDIDLFQRTCDKVAELSERTGIQVHYSVKANSDHRLNDILSSHGFGADCVSGDEIEFSVGCGYDPKKIFFAGVGKTDREICQAFQVGIGAFVVESIEEIEIIGDLAGRLGRKAPVSLRINPNIDAHTHHYITTGLYEDKFGISDRSFDEAAATLNSFPGLEFFGLQFHIGSQILDVEDVVKLECAKVNDVVARFEANGMVVRNIDLGGGLGVDYDEPDTRPIADFGTWFETIDRHLNRRADQTVHVEPGRSLVAQCGSLITEVLFVKKGENRRFLMVDAGMNDLIRPALYGAYHKIENLSAHYLDHDSRESRVYDVVGPVCESADTFGKERSLAKSHRGDLIAIRSAGAYGQVMASRYNMRPFAPSVYSDRLVEAPRRKDYFVG
ncbi:MAG TPA: diaminopimelate decarboxylase [Rikenellaceae bacterium]|nr:diaminopimelate decarboxylase [Rikenellaceae bacterium]